MKRQKISTDENEEKKLKTEGNQEDASTTAAAEPSTSGDVNTQGLRLNVDDSASSTEAANPPGIKSSDRGSPDRARSKLRLIVENNEQFPDIIFQSDSPDEAKPSNLVFGQEVLKPLLNLSEEEAKELSGSFHRSSSSSEGDEKKRTSDDCLCLQHHYDLSKLRSCSREELETNFIIEIAFLEENIVFPPKELEEKISPQISNSSAFKVFRRQFVELAKNWLDAGVTEVKLAITETSTGKVGITIQDNGTGFDQKLIKADQQGQYLNYAQFIDPEKGHARMGIRSDKRGNKQSYGGAGLGLAHTSKELQKNGGALFIRNVPNTASATGASAAITLFSPSGPRLEEEVKPSLLRNRSDRQHSSSSLPVRNTAQISAGLTSSSSPPDLNLPPSPETQLPLRSLAGTDLTLRKAKKPVQAKKSQSNKDASTEELSQNENQENRENTTKKEGP